MKKSILFKLIQFNIVVSDVRLVDEEGTPMSTPNTSGDDDSGDEVLETRFQDLISIESHLTTFRVILRAE